MEKKFVFNTNGVCLNPNVLINYTLNRISLGWGFDVKSAQTPKGWIAGGCILTGDSLTGIGCTDRGKYFSSENEAICHRLKLYEWIVLYEGKGCYSKDMLAAIHKYLKIFKV